MTQAEPEMNAITLGQRVSEISHTLDMLTEIVAGGFRDMDARFDRIEDILGRVVLPTLDEHESRLTRLEEAH